MVDVHQISNVAPAGQPPAAALLAWLIPLGCLGWLLGSAWQITQPVLWDERVYQYFCASSILIIGFIAIIYIAIERRSLRTALRCHACARLGAGLIWLVCGAVLAVGVTGWRAVVQRTQWLPVEWEGRTVMYSGRVDGMPVITANGWRVALQALPPNEAQIPPVATSQVPALPMPPPRVLLHWPRAPGVPVPHADEAWQVPVRLRSPRGLVNPHGFDGELWLWEQGVGATGYVRAGTDDPPARRLAEARAWSVDMWRERLRDRMYRHLLGVVQDDPATDDLYRRAVGVVVALVLGDQAAIDRGDWAVFRTTGVAHLMSISGLHITLWAWLASRLLARLWRWLPVVAPKVGTLCLHTCSAPVASGWGGWWLAWVYAVFSGWGVPAQRTILMLFVMTGLRQHGRAWPWPMVMLVAATAVLAWDPWALLQPGFWLSFVAVGVLMAQGPTPHSEVVKTNAIDSVASNSNRLSGKAGNYLKNSVTELVRTQTVVTLALSPLAGVLFHQISVVGWLANLVAIPAVTLVVTPLALAGVVWPGLWSLAVASAAWGMEGLTALAAWPSASMVWPALGVGGTVAALAAGVGMALRWPLRWRAASAAVLLLALGMPSPVPSSGEFDVLALDVGQGSAVLIRTREGSVLYDAGPRWGPQSDAGQRVVVPALQALGERLTHVVLSHRDTDHVGGAAAVLQAWPHVLVWSSATPQQVLADAAAGVAGQPVGEPGAGQWTRCEAGQQWTLGGVQFELLHPNPALYAQSTSSNNLSCVLWVRGAYAAALLTGDMDAAHEQALIRTRPDLRADWLMAPHHGSKTSSGEAFLRQLAPRVVVVQAGYRNRYGHPAKSVVQRYQALGTEGLRWVSTPDCGAVQWSSNRPATWQCQRALDQRYWRPSVNLWLAAPGDIADSVGEATESGGSMVELDAGHASLAR